MMVPSARDGRVVRDSPATIPPQRRPMPALCPGFEEDHERYPLRPEPASDACPSLCPPEWARCAGTPPAPDDRPGGGGPAAAVALAGRGGAAALPLRGLPLGRRPGGSPAVRAD